MILKKLLQIFQNKSMENKIIQKNIPNGWEVEKLGNVAEVIMGQSPSSRSYNQNSIGLPFIQGKSDFSKNMKNIVIRQWTSEPTKISEIGDILFTVRAPVGELSINTEKICIGRGISAIRVNKNFSRDYIYYSLLNIEDDINKKAQGSTFTAINREDVKKIEFTIPLNKSEQEKIAEILSKVDEDIEKTKDIIEETEKLKNGLMQELLTKGIGHTKFKKTKSGEIPEAWEVCKLSEITDLIKDGTHGTHKNYQNGVPLLSAKDIINGEITLNNNPRLISESDFNLIHRGYQIKEKDILLTVVGTIGRVSLIKDYTKKFTVQRSVAILRFKKEFYPEFYYQYLSSSFFQKLLLEKARGAAQVGVYLASLGEIFVNKLPIKEQKEIAEILSSVDEKISVNKKLKEKLTQLKKGLMSDLLSGKIRVI